MTDDVAAVDDLPAKDGDDDDDDGDGNDGDGGDDDDDDADADADAGHDDDADDYDAADDDDDDSRAVLSDPNCAVPNDPNAVVPSDPPTCAVGRRSRPKYTYPLLKLVREKMSLLMFFICFFGICGIADWLVSWVSNGGLGSWVSNEKLALRLTEGRFPEVTFALTGTSRTPTMSPLAAAQCCCCARYWALLQMRYPCTDGLAAWCHGFLLLRAQAGFACAKPVGVCFVVVTQSDVASFTCRIVKVSVLYCPVIHPSGASSFTTSLSRSCCRVKKCVAVYDFTSPQHVKTAFGFVASIRFLSV